MERESEFSKADAETEVPLHNKRKKGVRNTDLYSRNVTKRSRVEGVAYKGYSGTDVVAKKIGLPCR